MPVQGGGWQCYPLPNHWWRQFRPEMHGILLWESWLVLWWGKAFTTTTSGFVFVPRPSWYKQLLGRIHNQPGTAVCLCIKEVKRNVPIGIRNSNVAVKTIHEYMCIVQNLKQQIVDEGSTKKEFPPCIPDSRFPLCIPNSRKLPVKVLQRAKNSVIGNARNLLHYLGQYDSVVASALTLTQSKSQTLMELCLSYWNWP